MVTNVRGKLRTTSFSAATSGEWQSGGAGGLNSLGELSSRGVQVAAVTLPGFVPIQLQSPVGTEPLQAALEPSASAFAMTSSATFRPSASPAW